jgi:hypothetical protein
MGDAFKIIAELGFAAASAIAGGIFVVTTIKFLLAGVGSSIMSMAGIIKGLDSRIETMNNDLQRIDNRVSYSLGLEPDYDRIARAEQSDQRKD